MDNNIAANQTHEMYLNISSIEENEMGNRTPISVYPNPASQQITITTTIQKQSNCDISVFDLNGQLDLQNS